MRLALDIHICRPKAPLPDISGQVMEGLGEACIYAGGERVLKGKGDGQFVSVNGFNPSGIGFTGNYSMYVNAYLVVNTSRYTKHFYIEGQRVASKMSERQIEKELAEQKAGSGLTPQPPIGGVEAGGGGTTTPPVDYEKKHKLTKEALYAAYYAAGMNPEIATAGNSGKIPYGQLKKYFEVGNGNNGNNGNGNSGNGNVLVTGKYENLQFFYHPDHLGSSNYITDASGEVYQHNEYFPYGETFVEERNAAEYTNYLFSGKELDTETGLYYFGARYQDPRTSMFLNIDPMMDKYPGISPYAYCMNNPLRFIDPDGRDPGDLFKTINAAARDWGKYYNGASILRGKEFGSTIYKVGKKGETYYTYTVAAEGKAAGVTGSKPPAGEAPSAVIHSHGEYLKGYLNNEFSTTDKNHAEDLGVNSYVSTPDGSLKKYNQSTNEVTTLSTNMPSDPKDPDRKNKINPVDIPMEKKREETRREQEKKPNLPKMSDYNREQYQFVF